MKEPVLNIAPFYEKHRRIPDTDCTALWTFSIDGRGVSFWGTLAQASSTAALYVHTHDIEDDTLLLTDYNPMPKVLNMGRWEN